MLIKIELREGSKAVSDSKWDMFFSPLRTPYDFLNNKNVFNYIPVEFVILSRTGRLIEGQTTRFTRGEREVLFLPGVKFKIHLVLENSVGPAILFLEELSEEED